MTDEPNALDKALERAEKAEAERDALKNELRIANLEFFSRQEHSMKQQEKSFMGQFQAARQEVAQLRVWMGESAKVATLTFPTPRTSGVDEARKK